MELWRTLAAPCRILSSHTQTLLTLIYRSPPYLKERTRNYLAPKRLLFSLSGAGQGRESANSDGRHGDEDALGTIANRSFVKEDGGVAATASEAGDETFAFS